MPNFPTAWKAIVRLIKDGQLVDENETNKPLLDLIQRDQHLKDLLELLSASEALYVRMASVEEATKEGQPVYMDTDDGTFKRGLAAVDFDSSGNWGVVAETAFIWGIVVHKHTATIADIVTFGVIRDLDMSLAMDDPEISGPRYLSATEPGKLTRQKPAVSAYVLFWDADQKLALITPTPKESLEGHIHYRKQLFSVPAGDPNNPAINEKHEVLFPDSSKPGWLPADDAIFVGNAPDGAKFGYNISQHLDLLAIFPPIPIDSFYIEVYGEGWGTGREPHVVVRIDNNGIWWMRDDFGWAPWSIDFWEEVGSSLSSGSLSSIAGGDPAEIPPPVDLQVGHGFVDHSRLYTLSIYLWFTRMTSKTGDSVVASLKPCPGSPIIVRDCNCEVGQSTGHLSIDIDLSLLVDEDPVSGSLVLKSVNGLTFFQGHVIEKIRSLSENIVITGTVDRDDAYKQGSITIDFINPITNDRELDVVLVGLNNVQEESRSDILYLGYRAGIDASIRGRLDIPSIAFPALSNLKFRLRIIGTAAGTMPPLTLSYRRIPQTDANNPFTLPLTDIVLADIDLSLVNTVSPIAANDVVEVESESFEVAVGDTVFFTIERAGTDAGDTYAGTVGLIRQKGIITTT